MIEKPEACKGCILYGKGQGFSRNVGRPLHGVGLVGEALGEDEEIAGEPFVGRAGKTLDRLITRTTDPLTGLTLRREDFFITNVIRCRPPGNELTGAPYEHEALVRCARHFEESVEEGNRAAGGKMPVWLALGNQALRRLTGQWGIEKLRGYYHESSYGTVVGTYHPSYIQRGNWHLSRVFQLDLLKSINCARNGRIQRERSYLLHPSPGEVDAFIAEYEATPGAVLAFDIETPYDKDLEKDDDFAILEDLPSYTILRISFSFREGTALTMPWREPYIGAAKRLLGMARDKTVWNEVFDVPRLEANDCPVNGRVVDSMQAWHCLEPSLPMGLKFVATFYCPDLPPWKLQSRSDPEWYNAVDSDALLCCYNGISSALKKQGRWEMFLRHFVQLGGLLRGMGRHGIAVDRAKRAEAKAHFQERRLDVVARIQDLVPEAVKPKHVYKLDERQLKKRGTWREGQMVVIQEDAEVKAGWEIQDGWLRRVPKKRPAAVSATKRRRKKSVAIPEQ